MKYCETVKRGEWMSNDIIVALIAFGGTLIGTFGGILASSKLTAYRIAELEKKVDKHNNFAERIPVIEEKIEAANHRIEELEEFPRVNCSSERRS